MDFEPTSVRQMCDAFRCTRALEGFQQRLGSANLSLDHCVSVSHYLMHPQVFMFVIFVCRWFLLANGNLLAAGCASIQYGSLNDKIDKQQGFSWVQSFHLNPAGVRKPQDISDPVKVADCLGWADHMKLPQTSLFLQCTSSTAAHWPRLAETFWELWVAKEAWWSL